jgi:hypothetical protein
LHLDKKVSGEQRCSSSTTTNTITNTTILAPATATTTNIIAALIDRGVATTNGSFTLFS